MTESIRMSAWGWFLRAFAAGFGVMFGVFTASVMICCFSYMLFAAFAIAFANIGNNNALQLAPTVATWQQPASNAVPQLVPPPSSSPTPGTQPYCSPQTGFVAGGNPYANPSTAASTAYPASPVYAATAVEEPPAVPVPQEIKDDVQFFAPGPSFDASDEPDDDDDDVVVEKAVAADSAPVLQVRE